MRQTHDFDKAGTTDYRISVTCRIPLDDPEGEGNMGLIGADEEFRSAEAPDLDKAKTAAAVLAKDLETKYPTGQVTDATITAQSWAADTYEFEGETIQDAFSTEGKQLYGIYGDGGYTWDEEWTS